MGSNKFRLAVLVSGRGSNLQAIIDSIENEGLPAQIALVLSNVEDAHALIRAQKHGIEAVYLEPGKFAGREAYEEEMIGLLQARSVDLVCLAGFMRILGKRFIQAFPEKIVNIHPSLLPAFQGLNPQKNALDYGVKFSGCTVHFVDEGVDSGPIILQTVVPVYDSDDTDSLSARILEQEHLLYPKAIRLILENRLRIAGRKVLQTNP